MPVYSIIVPVYNVEKYLAESLDSILAQDTDSEYEILLIDDGSRDSSGALCDRYAEKYACIHVIHQANQGVSVARNTGIQAARGMYLLFMDSDDLIDPTLLSAFDPLLEKQADMITFGEKIFCEDRILQIVCPLLFPAAEGESGQSYLDRHFAIDQLPPYAGYSYLFRREFLWSNQLCFQPGLKVNEDLDFVMKCLPKARLVCGIDMIGYFYRVHSESVVQNPALEKQMMYLTTPVKWFRIYPQTRLAELFVSAGIGISEVGTREETRELAEFCRKNKDIWSAVKKRSMRLAVTLFRLFGVYNGSKVFLSLVQAKQSLFSKETKRSV